MLMVQKSKRDRQKTVTKHTDTISINGKHFNARTGRAVGAARNVDGILPKNVVATVLQKPAQYTQPIVTTVKKPVMDITRTAAPHLPKRHTQPGQTLMRRGLAKPSPSIKRTTKVVVANQAGALITLPNLSAKQSVTVVDQNKLRRASKVSKSASVARFSKHTHVSTVTHQQSKVFGKAIIAQQVAAAGLAKQPSMDIFEKALAYANGHEQTTPPHVRKALKKSNSRRRFTNIAASTLAVLLLTGFVGYQNLPAMKLQYASSKAGFQAELPNYRPSGFSLGKLSYQTGAVTVRFNSNSDERSYAISQKPSAWDSQTLRENFVAQKGQQYHTTLAAGRTIYLYGHNNATWINGGVWYQVEAGDSLTERQLTELASSI